MLHFKEMMMMMMMMTDEVRFELDQHSELHIHLSKSILLF
jgi:hypothetical protein